MLSHHNSFLNRCQICAFIAISRCLSLETKALHILQRLQKENESEKCLVLPFSKIKETTTSNE